MTSRLELGYHKLGFISELGDTIFLCREKDSIEDLSVKFHLDTANQFGVHAVFFRQELGKSKPQIYIYDYTLGKSYIEADITDIHKKVWSSGHVPLVCIFYDTEIKILDCTTHVKEDKPVFLAEILLETQKAHILYNDLFAIRIKSGTFWETNVNKNKFKFSNSAYDTLIKWIKVLKTEVLKTINQRKVSKDLERIINKTIVQAILIKYLEERQDINGKKLFHNKYYKEYASIKGLTDVLKNTEQFISLLDRLHKDFNGNLFQWNEEEKNILYTINLSLLSDALNGFKDPNNPNQAVLEFIRYYEFSCIPVELISRLYEEFLAGSHSAKESKKAKADDGIFYTPAHLAKLLVDESMPLKDYEHINFDNYSVLDPACGSGVFLVLAFKRIVQWWRLQNNLDNPSPKELKKLIQCLYGTDKEEQATQLAAFSLCLALCDELNPMQIISHLRFDDLTQTNILHTDFFIEEIEPSKDKKERTIYEKQLHNFQKIKNRKFDLVIGNPPFVRGGIESYSEKWEDGTIKIPQRQIALKFLSDSLSCLKENGIQCLIIKSSGLLYNSTSKEYRKHLLSNYHVVQVLDFTALARNKSLWEGAEVATAVMFIKNQTPDYNKNLLHLTFRRTQNTRERIYFEIDEYDFHFIPRVDAISNPHIWKINLLGGGRINRIISNTRECTTFNEYLSQNNCDKQEGHGTLNGEVKFPTNIDVRLISKNGIINNTIDKIERINEVERKRISERNIYYAPNIIISETLDLDKVSLKFVFNYDKDIVFKNRYVGIVSLEKNKFKSLNPIGETLKSHNDFYVFYHLITSAQMLINLNTSIMAYDIYNMPFIKMNVLDITDRNVINDVNNYYQKFLRHGERSQAVMPIRSTNEFKDMLSIYGTEFIQSLNPIYKLGNKKFRLSDVVLLMDNSFIATIFKYDNSKLDTVYHKDNHNINLGELTEHYISKHLKATRIIKIYDRKDTIIFIKPNQYRYWLTSIAYRDADKTIDILSKAGY